MFYKTKSNTTQFSWSKALKVVKLMPILYFANNNHGIDNFNAKFKQTESLYDV